MASKGLIIREGTVADCDVIAEHNVRMGKESESLDLDFNLLRSGALEPLKDRTKGVWYVIEVEGQVVAQLMITYEWSDWRSANMWWIQSVYVRPEHRRKGMYKQLYDYVKAQAKAANAGGVRLYVDKANTKAQSTYEAMGMKSHYLVYEESFSRY